MEDRNEISVELSALSAVVRGIGRETPYGVPVGYFEQFPALALSRINSGLTAFPPHSPAFRVPEGYFDGFAAQVLARIKSGEALPESTAIRDSATSAPESAKEELTRISPAINQISREIPYHLPEGYFDELSPVLSVLKDKPTYKIPADYFEEQAPMLTIARDHATYQVPEGYFAGLSASILEKVAAPAAAKVIPMIRAARENARPENGKVLKGQWWKYSSVAAIAACLLLIVSWPRVDTKLRDRDLTAGIEPALQKVSDQDLQAYLDDQHAILSEPVTANTATLELNEGDVKSILGQMSDTDLQQYMEEHGKADDLATN